MRILIVEDDIDCRLMLQTLVESMGRCDVAVNGKEAVRAFQLAHTNDDQYDLILLDILLPLMDGRQALSTIRELEEEMDIGGQDRVAVIMVSALDDADNIMGAFFKEGCEAYIKKPFKKEALITEIKKLGL